MATVLALAFDLVVALLVGGAAWMTGRATALVWDPWWKLVLYGTLLTFAVRFLHYAVLGGTLPFVSGSAAWRDLAISLVLILATAAAGRIVTRRAQMARQYAFLSARA